MSRPMRLSQHCVLFFGNKTSNSREKKKLCFGCNFLRGCRKPGWASWVFRGLVLLSSHPAGDTCIQLFSSGRMEPIASCSARCLEEWMGQVSSQELRLFWDAVKPAWKESEALTEPAVGAWGLWNLSLQAEHGFAKHVSAWGSLARLLHNLLAHRLTGVVREIKVLDLLILARYCSSNKQIKPNPSPDRHKGTQLLCLYSLTFWKPGLNS